MTSSSTATTQINPAQSLELLDETTPLTSDQQKLHFAAVVGVAEDEGLLNYCVANLKSIGIASIVLVLVDSMSAKVEEVSERFSSDPSILIHSVPSVINISELLTLSRTEIGRAVQALSADWLMLIDVDEFPVLRTGDIRTLESIRNGDIIIISRYNYARRKNQEAASILNSLASPKGLPLFVAQQNLENRIRESQSLKWTMHSILPKVLVRPADFMRLTAGGHQADGWQGGANGPTKICADDIVIAHIPFTTFYRFNNKVLNAKSYIERNEDVKSSPSNAWHWKWWIEQYQEGNLQEVFNQEAFSDEEFSYHVSSGHIKTGGEIVSA